MAQTKLLKSFIYTLIFFCTAVCAEDNDEAVRAQWEKKFKLTNRLMKQARKDLHASLKLLKHHEEVGGILTTEKKELLRRAMDQYFILLIERQKNCYI